MKSQLGIKVLKLTLFLGGILGAIVASPILSALDQELKTPTGKDQTVLQQVPPPPTPAKIEKITLTVGGMKSQDDSEKIKNGLKQNPGILSTDCDQKAATCRVEIASLQIKKEDVVTMIKKLGYQASLKTETKG